MKKMKYTKEDCIKAMKDFYGKYKRVPTHREWEELGINPSYSMINRLIGWNNCLKVCGFELNKPGMKPGSYKNKRSKYKRRQAVQDALDEHKQYLQQRTY